MAEVYLHINADNIKEVQAQLENIEKIISRIEKVGGKSLNFSGATSGMSSVEASAVRVERALRNAGNAISSVGRGLQGLGNMFGGRIVGTVKTMATAFGTMGLYGAAQGTVQRYDTMRMFPKQMALLGFNANKSKQAVDKLEQSVIGLPTGLDEIVESARQYIMLTGKMKKGTDIAIAANNALLSGGGDAQQRTWGQRQIRDLLASGKLRSQEWESLIKALGPGLKDIGKAMGYKNFGKFRSELKENKIAANEFIDALVKVGTGQGVLAQRAELFKDTLSAAGKNIKNALQKLGAEGIETLDNVLTAKTGEGVVANIVKISDGIKQSLIPALKDWITNNGDGIVDFLDRLKNYNWGELIGRIGKGLATYYNILTKFFTMFSPRFIGTMAVWAGPVGRTITAIGNSVRAFGGVAATIIRIFGKGNTKALDAAATGASKLGKVGFNFTNAFKGLALTAGITGEVALIGGVIFEYAKIMEKISNMNFGANLDKNMTTIITTLGGATGFAGVMSTLFGALSTIPGFTEAAFVGGAMFSGLMLLVSQIGEVIRQYVDIIAEIGNMTLPSDVKVANLGKLVKSLHDDVLSEVPTIPDSKVRSMENLSDSVSYIKTIADELKAIAAIGSVGNISSRIKNILDSVDVIFDKGYTGTDKREAKRAKNVLEPLSEAMISIEKIATAMSTMKDKVKGLIKRGDATELGNLSTSLTTMLGHVDKILEPFRKGNDEYSDAAKNMKNVAKSMTNIAGIVTTLDSVRKPLWNLVHQDKNGQWIHKPIDRIGMLVKGVLDAFDESHLGLRTFERKRQMQNAESVAKAVTNIGTIVQTLNSARKGLADLIPKSFMVDSNYSDVGGLFGNGVNTIKKGMDKYKEGKRSPLAMLGKRIGMVVGELNEVSKSISKADIDTSGDAAEKIQTLANNVELLPQIAEKLNSLRDPLKKLKIPTEEGEEWGLGKRLKVMVGGIAGAFKGAAGEDFGNLGANVKNVYDAVGQLQGICEKLVTIRSIIKQNFKFEDGKWTLGEKLGMIMSGLTGSLTQGNALTGEGGGTVGKLGTVAPYLEAIATQLGAISANSKGVGNNLKSIKSGIEGIGNAGKTYNGQLREIASNLAKIKSNSNFGAQAIFASVGITALGTSAKNQVQNLSSAASAAERLASAINSIPTTKTVNVQTNTGGGGLWNTIKNIFTGHKATGGMIHGPGGIDNVPTWLTAGEFVMRKAAVNRFGAGFMSRINNMDIDGAIKALSIRAGAGVFSRGGMVTNNYSRDNHANVTFNIGKASQGYSQRRANRWARALS